MAANASGWLVPGSPFRTVFIPKAYFFLFNVGSVFLLPFVNVFYRQCGFSEELIGVLCALKPWVAAPAGSLVVAAADASRRHFAILIAVYLIAYLGRSCMAFFTGFAIQLAIALLTEAAASPQGALVDAAVMASATDDGGYGRIRMWASVGWGATAPIAGAVVGSFGLKAAFLCFTALVGAALLPACLLPMEVLSGGSKGSGGGGGAGEEAGQRNPSPDGSRRLSCLGSSKERLGKNSTAGVEDAGQHEGRGDGAFTVHISGGSQQLLLAGSGQLAPASREGSRHSRGADSDPQAGLRKSWSIGTGFLAAGGDDPSLLPSPQRPLLATPPDCPSPQAGAYTHRSATTPNSASSCGSLEITLGSSGAAAKAQLSLPSPAAAVPEGGSVWQGLCRLLADVRVAVFFFLAFLMGIANGCNGYLFLLLQELGASGTLMGLCLSFNCAAEVPVFSLSGKILERLGIQKALNLAMGAYVLRLCYYMALPVLPSPWFVLPCELLQGLTFALAWSAGTVHCKRIAPPHLRSTVQSLFQAGYAGIGAGLGGLVGGLLYGSFGATAMYRTAALTLAVGWIAAAAVLRVWGGGNLAPAEHTAAGLGSGGTPLPLPGSKPQRQRVQSGDEEGAGAAEEDALLGP